MNVIKSGTSQSLSPAKGALAVGGAAVYGVVKGGQLLADRINPLNW